MSYDYLIAGAGFAGAVLAERLTSIGRSVLICDTREHIGGNAYDYYDAHGILVHKYGPHIFHTNSDVVYNYLSRFTKWYTYVHRVLSFVDGDYYEIPINLTTINRYFGINLASTSEAAEFLKNITENPEAIKTSEDIVVSRVGRELYEKFFRGYTRKQWGLDPSELNATVAGRIPVRLNRDNRYFTDKYQIMPRNGYTSMFSAMLNKRGIKIALNTDYRSLVTKAKKLIYTGPIDRFFNYEYGKLPYRSLEFRHQTLNKEQTLIAPVINYPNDYDYTRITEFKQLTGQTHRKTSIVYEYPKANGDPYYPIPRPENLEIYNKYKEAAEKLDTVYFTGRLATYKYYNMDQVVAQSLHLFDKIKSSIISG